MNSQRFTKNYPVLRGGGLNVRATHQREKILFIAAVGLALSLLLLVAVVANFQSPRSANAGQDIQPATASSNMANMVTVPVPEAVVPAGKKLSDIKFKDGYWPRNQLRADVVRDVSEVMGLYAKVDLPSDRPIERHQLTNEPMTASLPVAPGFQAVAIEVNKITGVDNFALPGSRVNVVLTYTEDGNLTSKYIVQNARVLSQNGDSTPGDEINTRVARGNSTSITLEVSPEDTLKLTTAREMGRLSLALVAAGQTKGPAVTEVDKNKISGNQGRGDRKGRTTGRARVGNREFIVDGDGQLHPVTDGE